MNYVFCAALSCMTELLFTYFPVITLCQLRRLCFRQRLDFGCFSLVSRFIQKLPVRFLQFSLERWHIGHGRNI